MECVTFGDGLRATRRTAPSAGRPGTAAAQYVEDPAERHAAVRLLDRPLPRRAADEVVGRRLDRRRRLRRPDERDGRAGARRRPRRDRHPRAGARGVRRRRSADDADPSSTRRATAARARARCGAVERPLVEPTTPAASRWLERNHARRRRLPPEPADDGAPDRRRHRRHLHRLHRRSRTTGERCLWKEDSTPEEPDAAIDDRPRRASAAELGTRRRGAARRGRRCFVHGTTIATNIADPAQRPADRAALHRGLPRRPLLPRRLQAGALQHPPAAPPEPFVAALPAPRRAGPHRTATARCIVPLDEDEVRARGRGVPRGRRGGGRRRLPLVGAEPRARAARARRSCARSCPTSQVRLLGRRRCPRSASGSGPRRRC